MTPPRGKATIARSTPADIDELAEILLAGLRAAASLSDAAEWFTAHLARHFPSIALIRVFTTTTFSRLPPLESDFARALAGSVALLPSTEILTLLGSAGTEPEWNGRRHSRGHLAIPLLDRARLAEIPMVSRLLDDLRFQLQSETADSVPFVTRAVANANGLFYVEDAATAVDAAGRKIISATDFVRNHRIHSVFGFGGSYVMKPMFVATIVFTQERITKQTAMQFMKLSSTFKAGTTRFMTRGQIFDAEERAG